MGDESRGGATEGALRGDVADVDRDTIAFGPPGTLPRHKKLGHVEDVDGDGIDDLMLHFPSQETGIDANDFEACLEAKTLGGQEIGDCDPVRVKPACGLGFEVGLLVLPLVWLQRRRRRQR